MPGAKAILEALERKGVTLFLVAKGDDERRKQINQLGLMSFFKKIIVNQSKSADDYRSCIALCPEGTKFFAVGDRVKEEIRHANECGMTTIWFRNGKFAAEEPSADAERPTHIISSLGEAEMLIV